MNSFSFNVLNAVEELSWDWKQIKYLYSWRQRRISDLRKHYKDYGMYQLALYRMVHDYDFRAELEYPIIVEGQLFWLDVAIPDIGLDIEYDGIQYHIKEKDKKRDELLKAYGWIVKRVNKKNFASVINSIPRWIENAEKSVEY